jgi:hypothetical protein
MIVSRVTNLLRPFGCCCAIFVSDVLLLDVRIVGVIISMFITHSQNREYLKIQILVVLVLENTSNSRHGTIQRVLKIPGCVVEVIDFSSQ